MSKFMILRKSTDADQQIGAGNIRSSPVYMPISGESLLYKLLIFFFSGYYESSKSRCGFGERFHK